MIEPKATWLNNREESIHSIAISLKRIADLLCGTPARNDAIARLDEILHDVARR